VRPPQYRVMGLQVPLCRKPFPRLCGFPAANVAGLS